MGRKISTTFLLFLGIHFLASAQIKSFSEEIRFISYLVDNSENKDALFVLDRLSAQPENLNQEQLDTVNFLKGWNLYCLKMLDSSSLYLGKVSAESGYFIKSKFYEAYIHTYLNRFKEAKAALNSLQLDKDSELFFLRNLELAGIALLQQDSTEFNRLSSAFIFNFHSIHKEEENLIDYYIKLKSLELKSPLLAGFLSAVIPGSGKFYAGYKGKAFSALLPTVFLAAVVLENAIKIGVLSPPFILFSGIFTVFYAGNIWGSALSVKTKFYEQQTEIRQDILFDLLMPVRRILH